MVCPKEIQSHAEPPQRRYLDTMCIEAPLSLGVLRQNEVVVRGACNELDDPSAQATHGGGPLARSGLACLHLLHSSTLVPILYASTRVEAAAVG